MPIRGVSEVVKLPRLGKIRLGIREEDADYPLPTDHFVCPEEVRKVFGDKPRELRIMFPTEDESQWAGQYLKCYSESGRLVCRGDGESAIACVDAWTGEIATGETAETRLREVNCLPDVCLHYQQRRCRRVMNLQFLLPECPGFGIYQLDTSSYHSIVNVNSMLKLMRGTCQRLSMLPLALRLAPKEVQPAGEWKVVHVLELGTACSLLEMQEYARTPPGRMMVVPLPDDEAPDDLFPRGVLTAQASSDETSCADSDLTRLWNGAKGLIRELGICDAQIAAWFWSEYQCQVSLSDFHNEVPPEKLTLEQLEHFCEAVEHCGPSS
jgi:hypothetical protein